MRRLFYNFQGFPIVTFLYISIVIFIAMGQSNLLAETEKKQVDLELTIATSGTSFHMCDPILITVMLKNRSITQIAEVVEMSYVGKTVNFIVTFEDGKEVALSEFRDVVPLGDRVFIEPNRQYKAVCDISEDAMLGWSPGKYKIRATYPYESLRVLPWPQKELVSNTIEITINPLTGKEKDAYEEAKKIYDVIGPTEKSSQGSKEIINKYISQYPESPFINRILGIWIRRLAKVRPDVALEYGATVIESNNTPSWLRYDVCNYMAWIYEEKKDAPEKAMEMRKKQLNISYKASRTTRWLKEEITKLEEKIKKRKEGKDTEKQKQKENENKSDSKNK